MDDLTSVRFHTIVKKIIIILIAAMAALAFCVYTYEIVVFQLNHGYSVDSPLFWTVGRGILNGIMPYSGLYENKPPAVFLAFALSFLLTDDTILCNVFCIFCYLTLGLLPLLCAAEEYRGIHTTEKQSWKYFLPTGTVILAGGLMLMQYCQYCGETCQVESVGAMFSALYLWSVAHVDYDSIKGLKQAKQLKWTLAAALFAVCSVMFKEPFILLMISGSFLLMDKPSQFISRLLVPMVIGGAACLLVMAATGILTPYFTIYMANMFGGHINRSGSPFERGLQVYIMFQHVYWFWGPLMLFLTTAFAVVSLNCVLKAKSLPNLLWNVFRIMFALYCASFAVGLGGQYFDHHYLFAVPLYLLFFAQFGRWLVHHVSWKSVDQTLMFALSAVPVLFMCITCNMTYFDYSDEYNTTSIHADYVDELLDEIGEERYQYLGFNGIVKFYGLTTHSPMGPAFAQDSYLYEDEDSWFCRQLLSQLDSVNIVIFDNYSIPAIEDEVKAILAEDFTTEAPQGVSEIEVPDGFYFTVYYRIGAYA